MCKDVKEVQINEILFKTEETLNFLVIHANISLYLSISQNSSIKTMLPTIALPFFEGVPLR